MATIVPRWEWRTFGSRFGIAETRFAALTPTGVQESDEVYLLAGVGDNVKIRDALMDIKVLREVDPAGLERWEPVMKQGFPLAAADVTKVFAAVDLAAPRLERSAYTLDQFLDELATPSGSMRPVRVYKRRVRYTIDGCTSEVTEIRADGRSTRSSRRMPPRSSRPSLRSAWRVTSTPTITAACGPCWTGRRSGMR
jgi:exopolyphosphatase/guanosine-5'-triphosphate,3'-diphosphate pyrophosphatase